MSEIADEQSYRGRSLEGIFHEVVLRSQEASAGVPSDKPLGGSGPE